MNGPKRSDPGGGDDGCPGWLLAHLHQGLAHDLPNGLVAIRGLSRLLEFEEASRLTGDGRDHLRRLQAAAERSHALVLALADLVQTMRWVEAPQPVALANLVREVAAELKQAGGDRTAAFAFDILVPTMLAPPEQLRRVLAEVMGQAAHARPEHRPGVLVRAQSVAVGIEIHVEGGGGWHATEPIGPVFDPFAADPAGHRLGLALARALVERWGGSIDARCEPEGGVAFTLLLPGRGEQGAST